MSNLPNLRLKAQQVSPDRSGLQPHLLHLSPLGLDARCVHEKHIMMSSYARVAHVELCPCCSCHGGAGCRALCAASAHDDTVRAVSPPTKSTSQVHIVCIMLVPRASESGDTSGCQCQCQCGPGQSRSLRLHATSCWRNPQAPTGHGTVSFKFSLIWRTRRSCESRFKLLWPGHWQRTCDWSSR